MAVREGEGRVQTICLLILSTVAIAVALYWLRPVLIPFVLAVFFAFGLLPLVDLQMRYLRAPRPLAVCVTFLLAFVGLSALAVLVSVSLAQLSANAGAYQTQIAQLVQRTTAVLTRLGVDPETTVRPLSHIPVDAVGGMIMSTTNAILGVLSQGLLVMVFLFFLLLGGTVHARPTGRTWREVEARIQRYIVTKSVLSAATGVLVSAILAALGIDLALVFGLFAFLLNFIPNLGSIIATLLPLPVVLVSADVSTTTAVLAIALPGLVQIVIGNLVEPKVMGTSLDLHPVTILLALIVWGMLWGIVGMLLATPITAAMKIWFERLDVTEPLADLFAGRLERLKGR